MIYKRGNMLCYLNGFVNKQKYLLLGEVSEVFPARNRVLHYKINKFSLFRLVSTCLMVLCEMYSITVC